MGKRKAVKKNRTAKVQPVQAPLDLASITAKYEADLASLKAMLAAQPQPVVASPVSAPQPVTPVASPSLSVKSEDEIKAERAKRARDGKVAHDETVKVYKRKGIIPQSCPMNTYTREALETILEVCVKNGSPILGLDRIIGAAHKLGEVAQRLEALEASVSVLIPITLESSARLRRTVKGVQRIGRKQRTVAPSVANDQVEAAQSAETEIEIDDDGADDQPSAKKGILSIFFR